MVAVLLRLTVHARHSLVIGLISFCEEKNEWVVEYP